MKFHLDGEELIRAPVQAVYSALTSPEFMAGAIPDLQSSRILDGEHFEAKIRVGISIVRGTVEMKFAIQEKSPQNLHAELVGEGSGAGSKIRILSSFNLSEDNPRLTKMRWTSDADLSGLISGIGSQILKGQSERQVAEIFQKVKSKLEANSGSS